MIAFEIARQFQSRWPAWLLAFMPLEPAGIA
jgi:hypothetical protein